MSLQEQQSQFASDVAKLINHLHALGYWVTFSEAHAEAPKCTENSHTKRLAIDLNLYLDAKYLYAPRDYIIAGKYWEKLSKQNRAGVFKYKPLPNHFERAV